MWLLKPKPLEQMKKMYFLLPFISLLFLGFTKAEPDLTLDYVGVWEGVRHITYSGGTAAERLLITFAKESNNTLSANIRFLGKGQDQVIAGGESAIVYFDYGYSFKINSLKVIAGANSLQTFSADVTGIYGDSKGNILPNSTRKLDLSVWKKDNTDNVLVVKSAVLGETLRYTGTVELTKL